MTAAPRARYAHARNVLRLATLHGLSLAIACLTSYWMATYLLRHLLSVSTADDLLGGMWAVIATIFVYRSTIDASEAAALSRVAATLVSFVLCQAYLIVFPFSAWGMVALIGIGSVMSKLGAARSLTASRCAKTVLIAGRCSRQAGFSPATGAFGTGSAPATDHGLDAP